VEVLMREDELRDSVRAKLKATTSSRPPPPLRPPSSSHAFTLAMKEKNKN
jgi:hypothetical protein